MSPSVQSASQIVIGMVAQAVPPASGKVPAPDKPRHFHLCRPGLPLSLNGQSPFPDVTIPSVHPVRRLKPVLGAPAKYPLTSICSVEYIKSVESVFGIIAEPNRRAILNLLVSSQQSVGEIERQLRMPQPAVSKHLRVLREAGFVESAVDAQRRLYRLKPEPFQEVDAWLAPFRRFWSGHVDALERHLDRMDRSTPAKRKTRKKTARPKPRK